jgi:hypothetical protein
MLYYIVYDKKAKFETSDRIYSIHMHQNIKYYLNDQYPTHKKYFNIF